MTETKISTHLLIFRGFFVLQCVHIFYEFLIYFIYTEKKFKKREGSFFVYFRKYVSLKVDLNCFNYSKHIKNLKCFVKFYSKTVRKISFIANNISELWYQESCWRHCQSFICFQFICRSLWGWHLTTLTSGM